MGTQLLLALALDPTQRSCRFCAQRASYCEQALEDLHLATDTSYNVRLMAMLASDTIGGSVAVQSLSLQVGQQQAVLLPDGVLCGMRLTLVLTLVLQSEVPAQRHFVVIARDPLHPRQIACSPDMTEISCRQATAYFVVDYQVDNCVASVTGRSALPDPPPPLDQQRSYVHYYYRALVSTEDVSLRSQMQQLSLCGESWLQLYENSHLPLYCDADQALFVALKPWHQAALYTTAHWLSGQRDTEIYTSLERLASVCEVRHDPLPYLSNLSALAMARGVPEEALDWLMLCEWATTNRAQVVTEVNVTLPTYFYRQWEWYFSPFVYVIYFNDAWMGAKSAALVALIVLTGVVALAALAFTLKLIGRTLRVRYHLL